MVQSWNVSKYYGQLTTVEESVARAGATFASAFSAKAGCSSAALRVRREVLFDPGFFMQMRVVLCATAVSALAILILILL
jgi:hypothetical protein